jgi:hypothetical protein
MRKCTCGNPVANNATMCPRCGHRFTRGSVKVLASFIGIMGVLGIIGVASHSSNDVPSPAISNLSAKTQTTGNEANELTTMMRCFQKIKDAQQFAE